MLALRIVNANESFAAVFETLVAVIVGFVLAPEGYVAGGVYIAEKLGAAAGVNVPQTGEQLAPPAVRVHVTPAFGGSFITVALTWTADEPLRIELNLLVIWTLACGMILNVNANS